MRLFVNVDGCEPHRWSSLGRGVVVDGGPAGGRSGATTNVHTSTDLCHRQQAPPTRWHLNDGTIGTLAAPTSVNTFVDATKLRNSRQSNKLGSSLQPWEPVKRRTSRVDVPATPSRTKQCYSRNAQQFRNRHRSKTRCFVHQQGQSCCTRKLGLRKQARGRPTHQLSKHSRFCRRMTLAPYTNSPSAGDKLALTQGPAYTPHNEL